MDGFGASDNEVDDFDDGPLENETSGMEIASRWGQQLLSDMLGLGNPLTCRWATYSSAASADICLQPGLSVWRRLYGDCFEPPCFGVLCRAQQLAAGAL